MATALPEPEFISTDADEIIAGIKSAYEAEAGIVLAPGQAEMLLINAFAYREQLLRIQANEAARQNLLSFARYPMIDYLGELVGVSRLPASAAECTLVFTLVEGHPSVIIPANTRVQSIDGKVVFQTLAEKTVATGVNTASILAQCTADGVAGNGYQSGDISVILDPVAYVSATANNAVTKGGADAESDDALRDRIKLAPSGFSCAGPRGAYEYFAKSAHPSIIDVGITSPVPGQVNIYPLIADGTTPSQEILDAVDAKVNDEKTRPLTDTVVVEAPEVVDYAVEVTLNLLNEGIASAITEQVTTALQAYADDRKSRLGVDVVISQIIGRCMVDKVYDVTVIEPESDIEVALNEVAVCSGITINIGTSSDE